MNEPAHYAILLFSLVDPSRVDLNRPLPESMGEQLATYLKARFGIKSLSSQLLMIGAEAYLVLHEVPTDSLPALCSLVDVQRTQLFRYEQTDCESVSLTPLNVKID